MYEREIEILKQKLGLEILKQLEQGTPPKLLIPDRSYSNVMYDREKGYLVLKDRKLERKLQDLGQLKPFFQTLLVAKSILGGMKDGQVMTKRDIFYDCKFTIPGTNILTFKDQAESDSIIEDIEVMTGLLREDMGVVADPKGVISGEIKIQSGEHVIDCSALGEGAWSIPSTVNKVKFIENKANFVLVVEKGAVFTRLNATKFWKKAKCLLVTGGGQPDRGTRRLVRRLNEELGLPVFILTDADSYGFSIYGVYKCGSVNLAYESKNLACPKAEFLGVSISDIFQYKIEKWSIKATEADLKRAQEMMKYQWFQTNFWQRELKLFLERKIKAEIETLSRHGYSYKFLAEKYLPEKLSEKGVKI